MMQERFDTQQMAKQITEKFRNQVFQSEQVPYRRPLFAMMGLV